MSPSQYLELAILLLSLTYLVLLTKEIIWCWPFAITGSLLSVIVFIDSKLYSEAVLYSFFALMGVYGWWRWGKNKGLPLKVSRWPLPRHLAFFLLSTAGAIGLGYFFSNNSDAERPYADAASTSFSFLATFLEAHKILSSWLYWIVINFFSVWLYYDRGLSIYAGQMFLFGILSIWGLIKWRQSYLRDQAQAG